MNKFKTIVNTQEAHHLRTSSVETPSGFNTKSVAIMEIEHKKIIINEV